MVPVFVKRSFCKAVLEDTNILGEVSLSETDHKIISDICTEGLISTSNLEILLNEHRKSRGDILEMIVRFGLFKQYEFEKFLESNYSIKCTNFEIFHVFTDTLLGIDAEILLKSKFFPFFENETEIFVATRNILDLLEKEKIGNILKVSKTLVLFFATAEAIQNAIKIHYREPNKIAKLVKIINSNSPIRSNLHPESINVKDPVIEFVQSILEEAYFINASDVHIEPASEFIRIRFRIDGLLKEIAIFSKDQWKRILNRLKIISGMNISEQDRKQNGALELIIFRRYIDCKFVSFPTIYGENIVIKITVRNKTIKSFDQLGFSKNNIQRLTKTLEKTGGIIIVSGPPESGKTTTLYSIAHYLSSPNTKIISFEEDIELDLPFVQQSEIIEDFAVEHFYNQNADIVLFGETKEERSAKVLLKGSAIGYKILTTLCSIDSISAFYLLNDMNIKASNLTDNIFAVISQNLVRKLCDYCKEKIELTTEELTTLRLAKTDVKYIFKARGCHLCMNSGYNGRTGVFEVLLMEPEISELICEHTNKRRILEVAKKKGFTSIFEDVRLKVLQGITDLNEIKRITTL